MSSGEHDPATLAFEQLRSEVALLRRAVEGLAAHGETKPINYSPTLGKLNKAVGEIGERLDSLANRPFLSMDKTEAVAVVAAFAAHALATPLAEFARAQSNLNGVEVRLTRAVGAVQSRRTQNRRLAYACGLGAMLGVATWLTFSGPIARSFPARLQLPERMAARTLGLERWEAGNRIMARADPTAWRQAALGYRLAVDNKQRLEACMTKAARTTKPVRCTVEIRPEPTASPAGRDAPPTT